MCFSAPFARTTLPWPIALGSAKPLPAHKGKQPNGADNRPRNEPTHVAIGFLPRRAMERTVYSGKWKWGGTFKLTFCFFHRFSNVPRSPSGARTLVPFEGALLRVSRYVSMRVLPMTQDECVHPSPDASRLDRPRLRRCSGRGGGV